MDSTGGRTGRRSEAERPSGAGRRARLFLALDLPADARAAVAAWRDRLLEGRDELRSVAAGSLHVTLVFLGWQSERDVERIAGLAHRAAEARAAPRLTPAGLKALPPHAPRLFALDLADEDGRCATLQAALDGELAEARLHRPEKRPFWPHLTLARVKRGRRSVPPRAAAAELAPFGADRLVLFRSTLRSEGALYEPLWEASLGA